MSIIFFMVIYIIENLKRRKINKFVNDILKNIDIIKKYYGKIQKNYNYDAILLL